MTDKNREIEKMAKFITRRSKDFRNPKVAFMTTATKTAESLYNAGYRKQSEGEWITDKYRTMERSVCSVCGAVYEGDGGNYCPNCGSRMSGGKNE